MLPDDELVGTDRTQEPADAQRESFLDEGVEDAVSLTPLANQPRRLEHAEMTRDRRTADRESPGDLACRQLACPELLQDLAACRVRERAEGACFLARVDAFDASFLALKLETKQASGGAQPSSCTPPELEIFSGGARS